MRSRRITIEGNRYLIFYTFDDEPHVGAAATADTSNVSATDEPRRTVARPDQISADERIATSPQPRAEDGQGV